MSLDEHIKKEWVFDENPIDKDEDWKLEKVARQIEALFTLAQNSGTEQEAMAATAKVQDLCNQYNLDVNDVLNKAKSHNTGSLVEQFVSKQVGEVWATRSNQTVYLHLIISELYNVRVVYTKVINPLGTGWLAKSNVIGFEINVDAARMTFDFLEREVETFLKKAKKEGRVKGNIESASYRIGLVTRMYDMAKRIKREADQNSMALTLVTKEAFDSYFEQHNIKDGKSRRVKILSPEAYLHGLDDGLKVNVTGGNLIPE